ncbi:MAG: hypothetical protein AUI85_03465 [Acidobacteriales bacterium 13_1_40CM_3_55_5]|nr:MAG: hypothetical protein AUI85_03465 [Acidobacteriales bacterium 13_1_40CM_3_55_5]
MLTQQQLMERSRRALEDGERGPSLASDSQKLQLQKKSEALKSQIAISKTEDASVLRKQLAAVESRLQKLETEGKVAQTIIQSHRIEIALRGDNEQWRANDRRTQQPTHEPYRERSGSTSGCFWYWVSRLCQRTNPHQSSRGRALVAE